MVVRSFQGFAVFVGALTMIAVSAYGSLKLADYVPPGGHPPGGFAGTTGLIAFF